MVDQQLLTIFIAVTAVAVLIQTGITVGLVFASYRMSQQADRAAAEGRKYSGRVRDLVDKAEAAGNRLVQLSASSRTQLHQMEFQLERSLERIQRRVS